MSREELQQLLADLESGHAEASRAIIEFRSLLEHFDDFSPAGLERVEGVAKANIGRAQQAVDKLPDFRGRA